MPLVQIIKKQYGKDAINVGDEGGFAPPLSDARQCLDLISEAIEKAGYTGKIEMGLDVAASEFYNGQEKVYELDFKNNEKSPDQKLSADKLMSVYEVSIAEAATSGICLVRYTIASPCRT